MARTTKQRPASRKSRDAHAEQAAAEPPGNRGKGCKSPRKKGRASFSDAKPANAPGAGRSEDESALISQLDHEPWATRGDLQSTIEELKASNEELSTLNSRLRDKVEHLDRANSDLTNLMSATGIATIFLDEQLRIKRFTPPTAKLLNLLSTDIGRPIQDFAPRFEDDDLIRDAEHVLATLVVAEKEVRTDDEHWYLRRILPYRGGDNRIGGVVITFIDISQRVAAEAQARRLSTVLLDSNDAVTVCDLDGRITAWNQGAETIFGYPASRALTMNVRELVPDHLESQVADLLSQVGRGEASSFETKRLGGDGRVLDVWLTATPLKDENGNVIAMATTERDITARRRGEEEIRALNTTLEQRIVERTAALQASERKIRSVLDAAVDAIIAIGPDGTIETFNKAAEVMFGYTRAEVVGRNIHMLMPSPYRENHDYYLRRYRETREPHVVGRRREFRAQRRNGMQFPVQLSVNEVGDGELFTGIVRDISEQRTLQEEVIRIASLEQRRIGEELHDSAQQALTGLGLLAENLSDALAGIDGETGKLAAKLAAGIAEVNQQIRVLAGGLIPVPIDSKALAKALEDLAERVDAAEGVNCRFERGDGGVVDIDDDAAQQLYRIAQEAINNALKHAYADTIVVRLTGDEPELRLEIEDDGIGMDAGETVEGRKGLGLRIMEHRCNVIGGRLTVLRRDAAGGTRVVCSLPRTEVVDTP